MIKRVQISDRGVLEMNKVASVRTGGIEAQAFYEDIFSVVGQAENGMILAIDKIKNKVLKANGTDNYCFALLGSAEKNYNIYQPSLDTFQPINKVTKMGKDPLPRLYYLQVGDIFTTNTLSYSDEEFMNDEAFWAALENIETEDFYGEVVDNGTILITQLEPSGGITFKVIRNTTKPDGKKALTLTVLKNRYNFLGGSPKAILPINIEGASLVLGEVDDGRDILKNYTGVYKGSFGLNTKSHVTFEYDGVEYEASVETSIEGGKTFYFAILHDFVINGNNCVVALIDHATYDPEAGEFPFVRNDNKSTFIILFMSPAGELPVGFNIKIKPPISYAGYPFIFNRGEYEGIYEEALGIVYELNRNFGFELKQSIDITPSSEEPGRFFEVEDFLFIVYCLIVDSGLLTINSDNRTITISPAFLAENEGLTPIVVYMNGEFIQSAGFSYSDGVITITDPDKIPLQSDSELYVGTNSDTLYLTREVDVIIGDNLVYSEGWFSFAADRSIVVLDEQSGTFSGLQSFTLTRGADKIQLTTPVIELNGDTLSWEPVSGAAEYAVYSVEEPLEPIEHTISPTTTFDLSTVSGSKRFSGDHYVRAMPSNEEMEAGTHIYSYKSNYIEYIGAELVIIDQDQESTTSLYQRANYAFNDHNYNTMNNLEREGYDFAGFYDDAAYTQPWAPEMDNGHPIFPESDKTVYIQWLPI